MKDDMVNYAVRMSQPAVQRVTQADSFGYLKETHPIFFGFVGKQQGPLWVNSYTYIINVCSIFFFIFVIIDINFTNSFMHNIHNKSREMSGRLTLKKHYVTDFKKCHNLR